MRSSALLSVQSMIAPLPSMTCSPSNTTGKLEPVARFAAALLHQEFVAAHPVFAENGIGAFERHFSSVAVALTTVVGTGSTNAADKLKIGVTATSQHPL